MPRSPVPEWRKRKEPILDHYVLASIEQAGGLGKHDPVSGHYGTLLVRELADREEAAEYVRALNRAALHLRRYQVADVGMSGPDGTHGAEGYQIRFRADRQDRSPRQHVLRRYGPDRSKWPYDPRRRQTA